MTKEFIVLEETALDTQKKIRTWLSTGYTIEIISQSAVYSQDLSAHIIVVTSLFRSGK